MSDLQALLSKARAAEASAPKRHALFLGTYDDKPYLPYLKQMFNGWSTYVVTEPVTLLGQLGIYCAQRGITKVVSTNVHILAKLLEIRGRTDKKLPSLADYQGSLFKWGELEIVFISPLSQLFSVSYGKFLASRFISKVVAANTWREATPFQWTFCDTPAKLESAFAHLAHSYAIAADIETFRSPLSIRCIGYCGVWIDSSTGVISTHAYVFPIDSEFNLVYMRKINDLPVQKIFQNGKYDNSYLLRYDCAVRNWQWDTAHFFHAWYSELPKDLGFLNAFFLREVVYWKDLAETQDLYEYYKYNAMDTWATANVWISQLLDAPGWARKNYTLSFPLVFPCLLAEMTGIERDMEALNVARAAIDKEEEAKLATLRTMVGSVNFNPGSPPQVKTLLKILGCSDLDSSDEKNLKKASLRHPINARILGEDGILGIRGLRKLASTYLRLASDGDPGKHNGAKEFCGRILYALNPHGTDTARLASREHHFWLGLQIQNIPRGPEVKCTLKASNGFYLGECDLEQAESRDTAHIAGDEKLIQAVSGTRDFHSVNCSAFFGVPYESIYDDSTGKTKDKKLRDLAKRVNHGANYNMGPGVLVDTMGLDKIWEAARLLKLAFTEPKKIAEYLLEQFHKTYPNIAGKYYVSVKHEVSTTRRITSRAFHHTEWNLRNYSCADYLAEGDWTRYCFGDPSKNKLDLNSYVAHAPQSLNARTLNEAFLKVFYEIALPNPTTFRLHAQIHDSILFSYAPGHGYHADSVRQCMEIPVTVRDVSGTCRTFTVPAALKLGKAGKLATYWSETE